MSRIVIFWHTETAVCQKVTNRDLFQFVKNGPVLYILLFSLSSFLSPLLLPVLCSPAKMLSGERFLFTLLQTATFLLYFH